MRQVVLGVALLHLTDEHEIILVQRSGQVVKIPVFRVNKVKLQHGKILLQISEIVIKTAFSVGLL